MSIIVGQETKIAQIHIALQSAQSRNRELPHILFSGNAGCGKTTMAKYVAEVCKSDFLQVVPENIGSYKSAIKLFDKLNHDNYDSKGNRVDRVKPTVIFIDEIHRMSSTGQEILGIAMENFKMETGRPNQLFWLPYFTVIGATTLVGELTKPFLNRFKMQLPFNPYSIEDSFKIVKIHSKRLDISITEDAIKGIAKRGRGVPRIIVGYIERARDLALAVNSPTITQQIVEATFENLGIDKQGFTSTEITILKTLYDQDMPVGLENISIIVNENTKTLKNEIEPYLIQNGFMMRSGSGRIITRKGREYLEKEGFSGNQHDKMYITSAYERT